MRLLRITSIALAAAGHACAWAFSGPAILKLREEARLEGGELGYWTEVFLATPVVITLVFLVCVAITKDLPRATSSTVAMGGAAIIAGTNHGLFLWLAFLFMGSAYALFLDQDPQMPK